MQQMVIHQTPTIAQLHDSRPGHPVVGNYRPETDTQHLIQAQPDRTGAPWRGVIVQPKGYPIIKIYHEEPTCLNGPTEILSRGA